MGNILASIWSMTENRSPRAMERNFSPRIIVQGGVSGRISPDLKDKYKSGTKESARAGYAVLMEGGTAVEAVEKAVRVLEENEDFNAGCGSFLNNDRKVECDAMIMRGDTLNYGAVFCGTHFRNPVSLAKEIMNKSPHCVLSGDGALDFAQAQGFETCAPKDLISGEAKKRLDVSYEEYERWVGYNYGGESVQDHEHDTVSAVAMDKKGNLACATSTGGIAGKLKGRVGDAPLIGCGAYANEEGSATIGGHGESIMKVTLARQVVYNMQNGQNAQESAENALKDMETRVKGRGGIIAIDKHGNFGTAFNTSLMVWASIKDETVTCAMEKGEKPEVESFLPVPRA